MGWSGTSPTALIRVVEGDLTVKRKQIAAEVLQAVVMASPVQDGAYRANHRVSLDGDDLGYDLQQVDVAGGETISRGSQIVGQIETPFGTATIQNNIPYAEALENGHSAQAPQGVYGPAFQAIRAKYSR